MLHLNVRIGKTVFQHNGVVNALGICRRASHGTRQQNESTRAHDVQQFLMFLGCSRMLENTIRTHVDKNMIDVTRHQENVWLAGGG